MPEKKRSKNSSLTDEELALRGIEYVNKKEAIKELEVQCKKCRKPLEEFVDAEGKVLATGSKLSVLPYLDVDVHLKKTLRTGKVLLPEAADVLRSLGLDEAIESVPVIREDVIERLFHEGKITSDDLMKIYEEKSSFAFSVAIKSKFDDPEE